MCGCNQPVIQQPAPEAPAPAPEPERQAVSAEPRLPIRVGRAA